MREPIILLVEDDQQQGTVYMDMLSVAGFAVTWEENADDARRTLFSETNEERPDVLVIDLHIPRNKSTPADTGHGYELVSEAKTKLGKNFPVIIISGVRSRDRIIADGILPNFPYIDIVEKPIGPSLVKKVNDLVRRSPAK